MKAKLLIMTLALLGFAWTASAQTEGATADDTALVTPSNHEEVKAPAGKKHKKKKAHHAAKKHKKKHKKVS